MKQMRASVFKARCLAVMNEIQATGEPVIVTKRGKPVVKVIPIKPEIDDIFGFMAGEFEIVGDIESPVVPLSHWKVMKKNGHEEMILLDTHVLIWVAREPAKLSKPAAHAIRTAGKSGGLAISAITLWELAWLATHGRLSITGTVDDFVEKLSSRTAIRPITPRIAALASQLPTTYSRDPSDRLIGATALVEGIDLVTEDRALRNFDQIRTIW